ncbi:MAG: hypothetical protein ACO2ZM_09350 [Francisellaceae bacterium]
MADNNTTEEKKPETLTAEETKIAQAREYINLLPELKDEQFKNKASTIGGRVNLLQNDILPQLQEIIPAMKSGNTATKDEQEKLNTIIKKLKDIQAQDAAEKKSDLQLPQIQGLGGLMITLGFLAYKVNQKHTYDDLLDEAIKNVETEYQQLQKNSDNTQSSNSDKQQKAGEFNTTTNGPGNSISIESGSEFNTTTNDPGISISTEPGEKNKKTTGIHL